MPTPAKRIQCLLRPDVLKLVEEISEEQGLSASKVVSMLVEEALENRGLFDKSRLTKKAPSINEQMLGTKGVQSEVVARKTEDISEEDMKLLQKFKALKEMGIL